MYKYKIFNNIAHEGTDYLVNEKCSQERMGVHLFRLHLS